MTYSTGFHRRVIARVQSGDSKSVAYRLFGISRSTLHSWLNRAEIEPLFDKEAPFRIGSDALRRLNLKRHPMTR